MSRKTTPTFDQSPMPNQTMKSGAKAVRGMPLSAMIIGSKMSASNRLRPKAYPRAMPAIAPDGKSDGDLVESHPGMLKQVAVAKTADQRE